MIWLILFLFYKDELIININIIVFVVIIILKDVWTSGEGLRLVIYFLLFSILYSLIKKPYVWESRCPQGQENQKSQKS